MSITAVILGVGTELTDGQIVNKNAAWISEQLLKQGIKTSAHLTIPDDRQTILKSLDYLSSLGQWLFVTGGLGPTSDDFTRDLISEWTRQPLEFHDPSWQHLSQRLLSRGFTVKEMQKQQAYFPKTSQVLTNREGTANGFQMSLPPSNHRASRLTSDLFVLPGPPKEIAAIWEDHIAAWIQQNTTHIDVSLTKKWDTLGVGESDVAVIVEKVLAPVNSEIEIGYRVHLPYVEVKVMHRKSQESKLQPYLALLTQELQSITVARDGFTIDQGLNQVFSKIRVFDFQDDFTGSFLLYRSLQLRERLALQNPALTDHQIQKSLFWIKAVDEFSVEVGANLDGEIFQTAMEAPNKSAAMQERRKQYMAEMALFYWYRILKQKLKL